MSIKVMSSQRFLNFDVVNEKIEMLKGTEEITIPVWETEMQDLNGEDLYVLFNFHHTLAAAQELGIKVSFEITSHPEDLKGEDLLNAHYMDSNWYYVDITDPQEYFTEKGPTVW